MKPYYQTENGVLYHGDCLEIMPQLEPVDLVLTDPPYGITACEWDKMSPDTMFRRLCGHGATQGCVKDETPIIFTASQPFTSYAILAKRDWFRYEWIWEKNRGSNFLNCKHGPMKEHESVLVFCQTPPQFHPQRIPRSESGASRALYKFNPSNTARREGIGFFEEKDIRDIDYNSRNPRSIIYFKTEVGSHPTQKPVNLFQYFTLSYSTDTATILDPFLGSGTTAIACERLGRKWIGIEISEKYCEISAKRIESEYNQRKLF